MIGHIVPAGSAEPIDDDEVATATGMNRAYVNRLRRRLAAEGIAVRQLGSGGKLRITTLDPDAARQAAHIAWQIIAAKGQHVADPDRGGQQDVATTSCLT